MPELEYLSDKKGQLKGVIIPIEVWEKAFPESPGTIEDFVERLEDFCLNKAMDEAKKSPLLEHEEALEFLEG